MVYTETDLQDVEKEIRDLSKNRRPLKVASMGKSIEYVEVKLNELEALRKKIQAELSAASSSDQSRTLLTTSSKGL